jgi:hypothetical protein
MYRSTYLCSTGNLRVSTITPKVLLLYFQNIATFLHLFPLFIQGSDEPGIASDYFICSYCTMFGYLIPSDHQLYRVTPLKTPFRLLIGLLQSQSHVTTFTHNYSLRRVTFTQLTILHVRNYSHLLHSYTFTLADFWAISYFLKLSQTLRLHTSKLSPRTYYANSLLKTAT